MCDRACRRASISPWTPASAEQTYTRRVSAGARGLPFDAYAVLGVSPSATSDDIHHAYRMLARRFHPDADRNDARASARFAQITEAYDILVDVERRRSYDLRRAALAAPRAARVAPGP